MKIRFLLAVMLVAVLTGCLEQPLVAAPTPSPTVTVSSTQAAPPNQTVPPLAASPRASSKTSVPSVSPDKTPVPRTYPVTFMSVGLAGDPQQGNVVLFGGENPKNGELLGNTWTWDGTNWNLEHPISSPPARRGERIIADPATGKILLFGGMDVNGDAFTDTWLWDGQNWSEQHPAHSPTPRFSPGLAADLAHRQVLLFGGEDLLQPRAAPPINDTWTWDGKDWHPKASASSPPAIWVDPALAYDPDLQKVVMLIGSPAPGVLPETWSWDGENWSILRTEHTPTPRYNHSLAYDPSRNRLIVAGGYSQSSGNSGYCLDVWAFDGKDWVPDGMLPEDSLSQVNLLSDPTHQSLLLFGIRNAMLQTDMWSRQAGEWQSLAEYRVYSLGNPTPTRIPEPAPDWSVGGQVTVGQVPFAGTDEEKIVWALFNTWLEMAKLKEADESRLLQDFRIDKITILPQQGTCTGFQICANVVYAVKPYQADSPYWTTPDEKVDPASGWTSHTALVGIQRALDKDRMRVIQWAGEQITHTP